MIKNYFRIIDFKQCEVLFTWIESQKQYERDLKSYPKGLQVHLSYLRGRLHLYNN